LLERILVFVAATVACDCAALVLWPGYGVERRRVAGSDSRAMEAERFQREHREGPSESTVRSDVIAVRDASSDPRWPRWGQWISAELELHSVLSTDIRSRDHDLGVLNLYARRPDAFRTPDQALARALAMHIAVAITAVTTSDTLQRAIDANTEVGQAVGILMERFGIESDEAMTLLRRQSQDHNVKVRTVAAQLLAEHRRPVRRSTPERDWR
jgi:GAF domain-containing protein